IVAGHDEPATIGPVDDSGGVPRGRVRVERNAPNHDAMIADYSNPAVLSRSSRWSKTASGALFAAIVLVHGEAATAQQAAAVPSAAAFTVFIRGTAIGSEQVAVNRTATGWTITSSGSSGAPVNLVTRLVQVRYTDDWKPLELSVDGTLQGRPLTNHTT